MLQQRFPGVDLGNGASTQGGDNVTPYSPPDQAGEHADSKAPEVQPREEEDQGPRAESMEKSLVG